MVKKVISLLLLLLLLFHVAVIVVPVIFFSFFCLCTYIVFIISGTSYFCHCCCCCYSFVFLFLLFVLLYFFIVISVTFHIAVIFGAVVSFFLLFASCARNTGKNYGSSSSLASPFFPPPSFSFVNVLPAFSYFSFTSTLQCCLFSPLLSSHFPHVHSFISPSSRLIIIITIKIIMMMMIILIISRAHY